MHNLVTIRGKPDEATGFNEASAVRSEPNGEVTLFLAMRLGV
jgi:hypothetical protein